MTTDTQLLRMVAFSARTRATAARLQSWAHGESLEAARLRAASQALVCAFGGAPVPVAPSLPSTERRRLQLESAMTDLGRTQRMLAWAQRSLETALEENALLRQELTTVQAQLTEARHELAATVLDLREMNRELQGAYHEEAAQEALPAEDSDDGRPTPRRGAAARLVLMRLAEHDDEHERQHQQVAGIGHGVRADHAGPVRRQDEQEDGPAFGDGPRRAGGGDGVGVVRHGDDAAG